jgi:type I restriction enzyme S subunit
LKTLTEKIADRDHFTPNYVADGVRLVSPINFVNEDDIDFDKCRRISLREHKLNRKKTDIKPGDIILHRIGAGLGRVRRVQDWMPEFSILQSLAMIRPDQSKVSSGFLFGHSKTIKPKFKWRWVPRV